MHRAACLCEHRRQPRGGRSWGSGWSLGQGRVSPVPYTLPVRVQVVTPLDPRIHFALVCGAKSCPPIKVYTADALEEGLEAAAAAFCESAPPYLASTSLGRWRPAPMPSSTQHRE